MFCSLAGRRGTVLPQTRIQRASFHRSARLDKVSFLWHNINWSAEVFR